MKTNKQIWKKVLGKLGAPITGSAFVALWYNTYINQEILWIPFTFAVIVGVTLMCAFDLD